MPYDIIYLRLLIPLDNGLVCVEKSNVQNVAPFVPITITYAQPYKTGWLIHTNTCFSIVEVRLVLSITEIFNPNLGRIAHKILRNSFLRGAGYDILACFNLIHYFRANHGTPMWILQAILNRLKSLLKNF